MILSSDLHTNDNNNEINDLHLNTVYHYNEKRCDDLLRDRERQIYLNPSGRAVNINNRINE